MIYLFLFYAAFLSSYLDFALANLLIFVSTHTTYYNIYYYYQATFYGMWLVFMYFLLCITCAGGSPSQQLGSYSHRHFDAAADREKPQRIQNSKGTSNLARNELALTHPMG